MAEEMCLKVYALDPWVLNKFFYHFAKTKFVADRAKLIQERGLAYIPWKITHNGETDFNFTDPEVISAIKGEMREIWHRFHSYSSKSAPIPYSPIYSRWKWVEEQKDIQRTYQTTIRDRLLEYNKNIKETNKILVISNLAASTAKLAADAAACLMTLGIGTSLLEAKGLVNMWGVARQYKALKTGSQFLAVFGIGIGKSYACALSQDWADAKSADLWITLRTDAIHNFSQEGPGFIKDIYEENLCKLQKKSGEFVREFVETLPKAPPPIRPSAFKGAKPPPGVAMKPSPFNKPKPNWAKPNSKPSPVPKPTSQGRPAPKPISNAKVVGNVSKVLTGGVWLMAAWSAGESLAEFKKHAFDMKM